MKTRTELMKKIEPLNTSDITIDTYTGFSYLHVDLNYKNKPVLWCAMPCQEEIADDEELALKISDINDIVFHYDDNAKQIIEKLVEICKEIGAHKIYGRVKVVKDFNYIEDFYKTLGFDIIHTPRDKKYDSAKIALNL